MKTKNPSTVDAVEQLATRLWKRTADSATYGSAADEWRKTQHHLWGVSDALFICGRTAAAELADELGFLANRRAQLELEQS